MDSHPRAPDSIEASTKIFHGLAQNWKKVPLENLDFIGLHVGPFLIKSELLHVVDFCESLLHLRKDKNLNRALVNFPLRSVRVAFTFPSLKERDLFGALVVFEAQSMKTLGRDQLTHLCEALKTWFSSIPQKTAAKQITVQFPPSIAQAPTLNVYQSFSMLSN